MEIEYKPRRNGVRISNNFWAYEFECRGRQRGVDCCNGAVLLDFDNIRMLEGFRAFVVNMHKDAGTLDDFHGFILNRVYSCQIYNTLIGGHPTSKHLDAQGDDLQSAPTGLDTLTLGLAAVKVGNKSGVIKAVGCYAGYHGKYGFIHIQTEENPSAVTKLGNVGVWGDFQECRSFYETHPDKYRGKKRRRGDG